MKILFLSPRQCWPARSGAKLREYHFIRALGKHANLTYVYFAETGEPPLTQAELPFCERIVGVPKPEGFKIGDIIRGVSGRWPLTILKYTTPEMKSALDRIPDLRDFDLVHVDSIHMIRYQDAFGPAKAIYNWHNIESELMRRYSDALPTAARRLYAAQTARKLKSLERDILRSAFGHVVCSERERDQLLTIAPAARVAVIENGVDTKRFETPAATASGSGTRIVFVGKMDYIPNVDAVTHFVRDIWPTVREKMPSLTFSIVGADAPAAVTALRQVAGVEVTGTVPDVAPYYRGSLAAIVPLRTGGGTRLKILEAMAARTPVISTAIGAEGLDVTPGRDILIAESDSAHSWIDQLTVLAASPERRDELIRRAFELVQSRYDWEMLGDRLWSVYAGWLQAAR